MEFSSLFGFVKNYYGSFKGGLMKRRVFMAGSLGSAVASPVLSQGLPEWKNEFIDKWVKGAWVVEYSDSSSRPTLFEVYSYSASMAERGVFDLRAATALLTAGTPGASKEATAKLQGSSAQVSLLNASGVGRFSITWRASDAQEGTITWLKDSKVSPVKLRRLSASEIDAQRLKVWGGEKPTFVNTSYFG